MRQRGAFAVGRDGLEAVAMVVVDFRAVLPELDGRLPFGNGLAGFDALFQPVEEFLHGHAVAYVGFAYPLNLLGILLLFAARDGARSFEGPASGSFAKLATCRRAVQPQPSFEGREFKPNFAVWKQFDSVALKRVESLFSDRIFHIFLEHKPFCKVLAHKQI